MGHKYLLKEYELCFEQLRFYDKREESILKYLISLTSAVAAAHFAIYTFLENNTRAFFTFQAVLSGLVFVATLLLFLATLQNRLYFVTAARQVNAIRKYFMCIEDAKSNGFKENRMYVDADWKALKFSSAHTFIILGSALISSLFAGASASAVAPAFFGGSFSLVTGAIALVVALATEVGGGIGYLYIGENEKFDLECP